MMHELYFENCKLEPNNYNFIIREKDKILFFITHVINLYIIIKLWEKKRAFHVCKQIDSCIHPIKISGRMELANLLSRCYVCFVKDLMSKASLLLSYFLWNFIHLIISWQYLRVKVGTHVSYITYSNISIFPLEFHNN